MCIYLLYIFLCNVVEEINDLIELMRYEYIYSYAHATDGFVVVVVIDADGGGDAVAVITQMMVLLNSIAHCHGRTHLMI